MNRDLWWIVGVMVFLALVVAIVFGIHEIVETMSSINDGWSFSRDR